MITWVHLVVESDHSLGSAVYWAWSVLLHCLVGCCPQGTVNTDVAMQEIRYIVQSTAQADLASEMRPDNYTWQKSVTGSSDYWDHTLVVSLLRSTKQTMLITDVPAVVGLLGSLGGAYSLMVLCFTVFFVVRIPSVVTEFRFPGWDLAKSCVDWSKRKLQHYGKMNTSGQQAASATAQTVQLSSPAVP